MKSKANLSKPHPSYASLLLGMTTVFLLIITLLG